MKHIKLFEEVNHNMIGSWALKPEVGDYVICDSTNFNSLIELVRDNIGKLIRIEKNNDEEDSYVVSYEKDKISFCNRILLDRTDIIFWRSEILYWSKDKEELEVVLDAKKYNL